MELKHIRTARRRRLIPAPAAFLPLAVLLGSGVREARGQEIRIAYIASWRIIGPEAEYQGSREAEQALGRDVESWNRELEERKQAILTLEREIEQKRLVLSEAKRQELEQRRSQQAGEYDRRAKEVYGEGGLVDRRNYELTKVILDRVKEAVAEIAREEGYDFVLDASDSNLWWANKDYDITDRVLAKLAEMAPATPAATETVPGPSPPIPPPVVPPSLQPNDIPTPDEGG